METAETWTCPSCGTPVNAMEPQCPGCRVSRFHAVSPTPPAGTDAVEKKEEFEAAELTVEEVALPCFISEARFSVVTAGGGATQWTAGIVYVTTAGIYFMSEKDALDTPSAAKEAAQDPDGSPPRRVAPLSVFVSKASVKRLVHGSFVGHYLEMEDLKLPLRLTADGWRRFVGCCRKLELPITS